MAEQLTLNQLVGSSSLPRLTSILSVKEPVRAVRTGSRLWLVPLAVPLLAVEALRRRSLGLAISSLHGSGSSAADDLHAYDDGTAIGITDDLHPISAIQEGSRCRPLPPRRSSECLPRRSVRSLRTVRYPRPADAADPSHSGRARPRADGATPCRTCGGGRGRSRSGATSRRCMPGPARHPPAAPARGRGRTCREAVITHYEALDAEVEPAAAPGNATQGLGVRDLAASPTGPTGGLELVALPQ